jgi:hypothetical protein
MNVDIRAVQIGERLLNTAIQAFKDKPRVLAARLLVSDRQPQFPI